MGGLEPRGEVIHFTRMIRVASYNIRRGLGTDWRRNLHRNLAVIREIDADVVAVQEADPVFGDLFDELPSATVEAETHYTPARLGAGREDIAWHGNVLLLRHGATVTEVERIALPSLEEQRGAVIVDVAVHGIQLRVVAMHLGLIGLWRTRQAIALLERMKAFESRLPTVMLGDTNEWTPGGTCLVHFSREHRVAALGRSFPSRLPIFALDKIMFSSDLQVTASGVHDTPLARVASDHLPVWAQLSLVSAKAVG